MLHIVTNSTVALKLVNVFQALGILALYDVKQKNSFFVIVVYLELNADTNHNKLKYLVPNEYDELVYELLQLEQLEEIFQASNYFDCHNSFLSI